MQEGQRLDERDQQHYLCEKFSFSNRGVEKNGDQGITQDKRPDSTSTLQTHLHDPRTLTSSSALWRTTDCFQAAPTGSEHQIKQDAGVGCQTADHFFTFRRVRKKAKGVGTWIVDTYGRISECCTRRGRTLVEASCTVGKSSRVHPLGRLHSEQVDESPSIYRLVLGATE